MAALTFEGGLNEQDESAVKIGECIEGYNFEIGFNRSKFKPRNPFELLGTATNAAEILGVVQLIKNDNTETTLVQAGDTVYLWDGTTGFTSEGTVNGASYLRGTTWSLGGYSVITDLAKLTVVKKWDGTTFSTLTTGLGASLYAKYSIVYLGRMWLFNVKAGSDTPHLMVASAYENPESYDTTKRAMDSSFSTGEEAFYMTTPDLLPINGVATYYNTLIVSTENGRLWKLNGTDSTDFQWVPFYANSCAGGTGTFCESMANIGNDVIYMKSNGQVESLITTQDYGDVATDDVSKWIRSSTSGLTGSRIVYDQARQKVYFFNNQNNLLVLFKDASQSGLSPWSKYKTDHTSSFSTSCAIYMRQPGGTDWYVYFGDSSGNIYQMDSDQEGDPSSTAIETYRKSRFIELFQDRFGNVVNPEFKPIRGRVYYRRVADCDLLLEFEWADDYAINTCTVPLEGPSTGDGAIYFGGTGYFGGSFYFNTGFQFSERTSTKGFAPVGRGPGFYVSTIVQSTKEFDILKLEI
jgi:hypothetical protein